MTRMLHLPLMLAMLLLVGTATATTYRVMTIDEMIAAADIAFYGEVRDVVVFERDGDPWTRVVFLVERDLRADGVEDGSQDSTEDGTPAEADPDDPSFEVELAFLGGRLPGGPSLTVALVPTFSVGDRVVVFAYSEEVASPIVGFRQGVWWEDGDSLRDADGRVLGIEEDVIVPGAPATSVQVLLERFSVRFEALR